MKNISLRSRRGSALIELLMGIALSVIVVGILSAIVISTSRMGSVIDNTTSLQGAGWRTMDRVTQDIQSASGIVPTYLSRNGTTYSSNLNDTLVLQSPAYDAGGNVLGGRTDYIVYHLIQATNTSDGPYMLQQIVEPDALSARMSQSNRIVARNVSTMKFTYLVHQTTVSNGLDLNIGLDAGVLGTGADAIQKLTVGGKPFIIGTNGQASVVTPLANATASTLVFVQPPQNNAVIDLLYAVAPWLLPKNVDISQINVDLSLAIQHPYLRPTDKTTVDFTSSAVLRNR